VTPDTRTADDPRLRGLVVHDLVVRDGNRDIVRGLNLEVAFGERVAVTGPSRSDVSEVLASIVGLRVSVSGRMLLDDSPLGAFPPPDRVGYLSQDHRLIGTLTAVENLLVTMVAGGGPVDRSTVERAEEQLDALALAPATWHNLVEQLSGGQQQRVALGRALVLRPRLLVLDHPTSELDPDTVELVDRLLREVTGEGVCCLLASDDDAVLRSCRTHIRLPERSS